MENFWNLIAKDFSGQISQEEKSLLNEWLNIPSNRQAYEEYKMLWNSSEVQSDIAFDEDKAWQKFSERISNIQSKETPLQPSRLFLKIAAVLVLVLCGSYLYFTFNAKDVVVASTENIQIFTLNDGSKIWLNKNSSLTISNDFNKEERVVYLKGEAFFEVSKNPDKPFIIYSRETKTRVLGTSFNINAYEENGGVEISVETGRVEFSGMDGSNKVILVANQEAVFNVTTTQITKNTSAVKSYYSWKNPVKNTEKKQNSALLEVSNPSLYLHHDFTWRDNIVKQTIIEGQIHNTAIFTTYKNITLKATHYNSEGVKISTEFYTIPKKVIPGDQVKYKFKLNDWFKETKKVEVSIEDVHVLQ
ncbi:MAG: FecR family protein [Cytophagaceae bacterium]|nr:FecR family protein [Cytophagaceae bacterium]